MRKLIKVLILSLSMMLTNLTNTSSLTNTPSLEESIRNTPIELISLSDKFNLTFSNIDKITNYPILSPLNSTDIVRISSYYGIRIHPIFKTKSFHTGIDYAAIKNTPIRSTGNGIVLEAKYRRGYGKQILIEHSQGYSSKYAHLNDYTVKIGDIVAIGDTIGYVGSTGTSTGNHLHYEIRYEGQTIDPLSIYPQSNNEENYISYFNSIDNVIDYSDKV